MEKASLFCTYLFRESQKINLSIEDYIERKIPKQGNRQEIKFTTYMWQISETGQNANTAEQTIEEAISKTNLDDLIMAVDWFSKEVKRIYASSQKLADFQKLEPLERDSIIPEHDHIDRLMRYQTTLQRQLSTSIGELIALTKTT